MPREGIARILKQFLVWYFGENQGDMFIYVTNIENINKKTINEIKIYKKIPKSKLNRF
jgi:hypothetical protein